MPEISKRLVYVDIAKCLALVLVVYSHIPGALCQQYLGSFFIFAFFFLSGFTGGTRASWKDHTLKRLRRLIVPYLVFCTALVLISGNYSLIDFGGIFYSRFSLYPLDVNPNVLFFRSYNGPLWFLTAMFVSDMVYYSLVKRLDNIRKTLIAIFVMLALLAIMQHLPILLPWSLDTMPFFVIAMFLGHMARQRNLLQYGKVTTIIIAIMFIASCYFNGQINLSVRIFGNSIILSLVGGITGTLLLLNICKLLERYQVFHLLAIAGQHTLTVFSIQMAVIHVCKLLLAHVGYSAENVACQVSVSIAIILIVFAVGIPVSMVLKRLCPSVF